MEGFQDKSVIVGRRNSYLSKEEETVFLLQFVDAAQAGRITTITQIHQAFEKQVGQELMTVASTDY